MLPGLYILILEAGAAPGAEYVDVAKEEFSTPSNDASSLSYTGPSVGRVHVVSLVSL